MELLNIINPILSGIFTGIVLLTVSLMINRNKEKHRCQALISFLRLEILHNHRLLQEFQPGSGQPPLLEDKVWEKVNTEIIDKLPLALRNHLIEHYYFIHNSTKLLPLISPADWERHKNRMTFLIVMLHPFCREDRPRHPRRKLKKG